jgi:hypothetical protein
MNAKSTKSTGTKTSTAKTTLQKTQARAANRQAKLVAKHDAIRKSIAKREPNAAPKDNAIFRAAGLGQMTEALHAATVEELQAALALTCWTDKQRGRIEATLKTRTTPAPVDDVAKTVAAVTTGDLTKGVEVPKPAKRAHGKQLKQADAATKAAKADRQMSGLDAAAKVLAESPTPLNAKAIVEQAAAKGYWTSPGGKTPAGTIYAAMLIEARKKGTASRFAKVDRGLWTLTEAAKQAK